MKNAFLFLTVTFALVNIATLVPTALAQETDGTGWLNIETRHFKILSDADPERATEIAENLELFRGVFAHLAPDFELRSPAPTHIYIFRDAESYAPFHVGKSGARVLGQFGSHTDGNYLTLDADTADLVGPYAVVYHEFVHYLVKHNFSRVPLWFNEGLAEYYSTFAVEDGHVVLGRPVERHLRWLSRDPEIGLSEVLETTRSSSSYREGQKAGRFYAVSWTLVHYLLSGGTDRLDAMADFFFRLAEGEDAWDAFENAFDIRLGRMEETLIEYVAGGDFRQARIPVRQVSSGSARVREAEPADVLAGLGDLLTHQRRSDDAQGYLRLAFDNVTDHPRALTGMGLILDLDNRFEEASVYYQDALAAGSRDPATYLYYGRNLLLRAQRSRDREEVARLTAESRRVLTQGTDMDGSFGELWVFLGTAHQTPGGDTQAGIRALRKAHELLPDRHDVVLKLVKFLVIEAEFNEARRLIETGLAARGAPEEKVEEAREDVERARLLHASQNAYDSGYMEDAIHYLDEAVEVTTDPVLREQLEDRLRILIEKEG